MFLQVRPSGSSHEEAHLERDGRETQPRRGDAEEEEGEKKQTSETRMKQTPSPDQSLGGTVPEQSGGSVFQPKHAVLHHTETQCLRDLSLEKGALKVVCCDEKNKIHG